MPLTRILPLVLLTFLAAPALAENLSQPEVRCYIENSVNLSTPDGSRDAELSMKFTPGSKFPVSAQEFLRWVNEPLLKIRAQGLRTGRFNLELFFQQERQLSICLNFGGFIGGINSNLLDAERNTAVYNVERRQITLQRIGVSPTRSHDERVRTFLHETLGALGYVDDDSQISIILIHLSQLDPASANAFLQSSSAHILWTFQTRTRNVTLQMANLSGGSSTSTGGGGSGLAIQMKSWLFDTATTWMPAALEFLRRQNRCFAEDSSLLDSRPRDRARFAERLASQAQSVISRSEFESDERPEDLHHPLATKRPDGGSFEIHINGIFSFLASQLPAELVEAQNQQTYWEIELAILNLLNPHPCHVAAAKKAKR